MLSIYNFLKVKLCYRTYWKQWLAFLTLCFLVFACNDENNCEEMQTIVVDCECSFNNPNTFTVFVTTEDEENCEILEDCYCECFNDVNENGICDEDE